MGRCPYYMLIQGFDYAADLENRRDAVFSRFTRHFWRDIGCDAAGYMPLIALADAALELRSEMWHRKTSTEKKTG